MENYTPNANTFHGTIRIPEDGLDKRNGTTLAAAPEDLGDNIAFIHARTYGRVGSLASMSAYNATEVANGDLFFAINYGAYHYDSSVTLYEYPWVIQAFGVGGGAWVHNSSMSLLSAAPRKIKGSLMPGPYITKLVEAHTSNVIGFPVTGFPDWTTVADASSIPVPLSMSVIALTAGDVVEGSVGPFNVIVGPKAGTLETQTVQMRIRINNGTSDIFVGGPILVTSHSSNGGGVTTREENRQMVDFPFRLTMPANGGINLYVECIGGSVTTPGAILSPDSWGPVGQWQWARLTVIRGA